jgi:hypothetical protein
MWNAGVVGAPIIWLPCYVGLRSWTPAAVDRRDHWVIQLPAGLGCSYRAIWLWVAAPFPLIVTNQDSLTERRAILDRIIGEHRGRIANTAGDSVLAEFGSAVEAVQCAVEAQTALAEANSGLAPDRRISFRIGIH